MSLKYICMNIFREFYIHFYIIYTYRYFDLIYQCMRILFMRIHFMQRSGEWLVWRGVERRVGWGVGMGMGRRVGKGMGRRSGKGGKNGVCGLVVGKG